MGVLGHSASAQAPVNVTTRSYDTSRTGLNPNETVLSTSNVNLNKFGLLYTFPVDGQIYAQPLYVSGLNIPGIGIRNVVFVVTMHDSVYAFDADNLSGTSAPIWQDNFLDPAHGVTTFSQIGNINPEEGILSTPVIDLATNTIYLTAKTLEQVNGSGVQFFRLHALDLVTGAEKFGGPVIITATVPGLGAADADANGNVTLNPVYQHQRPGILLNSGLLYLCFGSRGDEMQYHGWVMAYDAQTLQQVTVFNDTPHGNMGGIWMAGQGPAVDASGNVYLMTGNGTFDANDYGNSILKLGPVNGSLGVLDWFAPYNMDYLNSLDQDLGSAGCLLLPNTTLAVGGGKQGLMYVVDTNHMGGQGFGNDAGAVQTFQAAFGAPTHHIHGTPVYWNGPAGPMIYVWGENDVLRAYKFVNGAFQTSPYATGNVPVVSGMPGGILSASSNGGQPGSGIIWANLAYGGDAVQTTVTGIMRAYDATTLKELWNTRQLAWRDDFGNFAKHSPPTVANGKVYLSTFSNKLAVYGLLPPPPSPPASPTLSAGVVGNSIVLSWPAVANTTSYTIYRGTVSGGESPTPVAVNVIPNSFTDTTASPGTLYYYKITAVNPAGESALSNEASQLAPTLSVTIPSTAAIVVQDGSTANKNLFPSIPLPLKTDGAGFNRIVYLRFDLSSLSGSVQTAQIKLLGSRPGGTVASNASCYVISDNTWGPTTITWNNRPPAGAKLSTTAIAAGSAGVWYSWDVTSYVQTLVNAHASTLNLTLIMDTPPSDHTATSFDNNANAPRLTVTALANQPPTIASGPSYSPNPATGTTTQVSAIGADDTGESQLTYTWVLDDMQPPGTVTFSPNGTNSAKNTTATFSNFGTYNILLTVTDPAGLTASTPFPINVNETLTTLTDSPSTATINAGEARQFVATGTNQFGTPYTGTLPITWSVNDPTGSIDGSGLYTSTAGSPTATYTVTASSMQKSGTASVSVVGAAPPPPPSAPTLNTPTPGNTQATLSWNTVSGATSYRVYRGTAAGGESGTPVMNNATPPYVDPGLTNDVVYFYYVVAAGPGGSSSPSNEVSVMPVGPPVTTTLPVLAATYVMDGANANSSFGPANPLVVKNDAVGFNRVTYVKFDISHLGPIVQSAKLNLFGGRGVGATVNSSDSCFAIGNTSWTETTLTWNNRPLPGSLLSTLTISGTTSLWYQWDVTAYVQSLVNAHVANVAFAVSQDAKPSDNKADNYAGRRVANPPALITITQ